MEKMREIPILDPEATFNRRGFLKLAGAFALNPQGTLEALSEKRTAPEHPIYTGFAFKQPVTPEAVRAHEKLTGLEFSILHAYWTLSNGKIDDGFFDQFSKSEKMPLISVMPGNTQKNPNQPEFSLDAINKGRLDNLFMDFADKLKKYDKPALVSFAPEMNGNWYSWGWDVGENNSSKYVAAYKRFHNILVKRNATKVTLVWTPNVPTTGSAAFEIERYFPGDDLVDWVGIVGYNWGRFRSYTRWEELPKILDRTHPRLTRLTNKPIMIVETSSAETGGDKGRWFSNGFGRLPEYGIRALVIYNQHKPNEPDFRVESSQRSLDGFRQAVAPKKFSAKIKTADDKLVPAA